MKPIIVIALIALTGCATMFDGSTQQLTIATENSSGEKTICSTENEEGKWNNLAPFKNYTIHKDGNTMKVSCENDKQVGVENVESKFQSNYLVLDLLWDLCIISCTVDGINNSFYKYPYSITVPMADK